MVDAEIYTQDQALHVVLLHIFKSEGGEKAREELMYDLGPGEVTDGGVRLVENPPLEKIPDWLFDQGLHFIEEDEQEPVEEAYKKEFYEKFGADPEILSENDD